MLSRKFISREKSEIVPFIAELIFSEQGEHVSMTVNDLKSSINSAEEFERHCVFYLGKLRKIQI
jgi:hypothetical protein